MLKQIIGKSYRTSLPDIPLSIFSFSGVDSSGFLISSAPPVIEHFSHVLISIDAAGAATLHWFDLTLKGTSFIDS